MIVVDPKAEDIAVREASGYGIPIIGLCDSSANTNNIDMVVPGNACGEKSIELFLSKLRDAIKRGQDLRNISTDKQEVDQQFDPWMFSRDRQRAVRKRSK